MSTFVSHLSHDLLNNINTPNCPSLAPLPSTSEAQTNDILREYYVRLTPPATLLEARQRVEELRQFDSELKTSFMSMSGTSAGEYNTEREQFSLQRGILAKVVLGLYVQSLELLLQQASSVDTELEWWKDVAQSKQNVALYLLQTLPIRLTELSRTIVNTVARNHLPLQLSTFSPSSLRQLFPAHRPLQPHTLTVALFPYLKHLPYVSSLRHRQLNPSKTTGIASLEKDAKVIAKTVFASIRDIIWTLWECMMYPIDLVQGECDYKIRELEKIRDERAQELGMLSVMRSCIRDAVTEPSEGAAPLGLEVAGQQMYEVLTRDDTWKEGVPEFLRLFMEETLPKHIDVHESILTERSLRRPSRLSRLWPRIVFLPPLIMYLVRSAYVSRASLAQLAKDTVDTMRDFWEDWLLAPLKDVVKTVRAGTDDGVIITRESVKADLDSLERMTLALAQDKLGYGPNEMAALSAQIRLGDLTPVMQLYEDDIKSPLRSAVGGSLLRTLFIQVQKAKVDIDQALAGIDKLLKSQELTFAFVGVAPALAIVYSVGGVVHRLWSGSTGKGRYGGKRRRVRVWLAMRRIERLLIAQPNKPRQKDAKDTIAPLTSGLLLLSVTYLRKYAETHLPAKSRLREGFLDDITHLENPDLGRAEKMRVVDRMWNSWGGVLGWGEAAVLDAGGGAI